MPKNVNWTGWARCSLDSRSFSCCLVSPLHKQNERAGPLLVSQDRRDELMINRRSSPHCRVWNLDGSLCPKANSAHEGVGFWIQGSAFDPSSSLESRLLESTGVLTGFYARMGVCRRKSGVRESELINPDILCAYSLSVPRCSGVEATPGRFTIKRRLVRRSSSCG